MVVKFTILVPYQHQLLYEKICFDKNLGKHSSEKTALLNKPASRKERQLKNELVKQTNLLNRPAILCENGTSHNQLWDSDVSSLNCRSIREAGLFKRTFFSREYGNLFIIGYTFDYQQRMEECFIQFEILDCLQFSANIQKVNCLQHHLLVRTDLADILPTFVSMLLFSSL